MQWKRVVVHGSCASDLRQSGRPDRPEACLCVKIGTAINVYPVGVPGAKKLGQNSLNWGASTHISSTHRGPLDLTSEPLRKLADHLRHGPAPRAKARLGGARYSLPRSQVLPPARPLVQAALTCRRRAFGGRPSDPVRPHPPIPRHGTARSSDFHSRPQNCWPPTQTARQRHPRLRACQNWSS